jgi:tol-pal system protein YbgF
MMKIPYHILLIAGLSCGLATAPGQLLAADKLQALEARLERLERILRNQSLADIILQLQQLQREVQNLRGELELQAHNMEALHKRQRDLYLDIDQRLATLQPAPSQTTGQIEGDMPTITPEADIPAEPAGAAAEPSATAPSMGATPVVVTPPDPKQESEAYQAAFNLLKQGRYPESIQAFQDFLANYAGGTFEDNAQYWLGEASYVSRDYTTALTEFTKVIERYPESAKVPGALLKSAYIYYEKRDWAKARELFSRVNAEYSGSTEARLAAKRLERMDKQGH